MTDENTRAELGEHITPRKGAISMPEVEKDTRTMIGEMRSEYSPNKIHLVDQYAYREDKYPIREVLKQYDGATSLMEERLSANNRHEKRMLEPVNPSEYVRVGTSLSRGQDVLKNTVHNLTTLHGMRELMSEGKGDQEDRLKKAIGLERREETKFDSSLYNPAADFDNDIPYDRHSDEKSVITSFVNKNGGNAKNPLVELMRHLNVRKDVPNHISTEGVKNLKYGQETHGDAGLPIGEKQF